MAAGNPALASQARQIIESLNARGAGPNTPGPSGANPQATDQSLSQRMAELRGADPNLVMQKLNQMKKDIVELIPQVAFTIPAVSKHLSTLLKSVDGALKEIEQAVNVESAVSKGPIGHTAAQGMQPSPGGESPMSGGVNSLFGM